MFRMCLLSFVLIAGSPAFAQESTPPEKSVEVLREIDPGAIYVDKWLNYMGLEESAAKSGGDDRAATANFIDTLRTSDATAKSGEASPNVDAFIESIEDENLVAVGLYAFYNDALDDASRLLTCEEFNALLPEWSTLRDFPQKFVVHYAYVDQAWQAHAEGAAAAEACYHAKVVESALRLMEEHPYDPNQAWIAHDYAVSSKALGVEALTTALQTLKDYIDTLEPCALRWAARYQVGYFSQTTDALPDEHEAQYTHMIEEMDDPFMTELMEDPRLMGDAAGIIEQLKGHALLGMLRLDEAEAKYTAAAELYESRLEWTPRKIGRTVADRREYGVRSSLAYGLAMCKRVKLLDQPGSVQPVADFLSAFPQSEYAEFARYELAKIHETLGDLQAAETVLQDLVADYPDSPIRSDAENRLTRLSQSLQATTPPSSP